MTQVPSLVMAVATCGLYVLASILGGCNILAPVAMIMEAVPIVPAQYELDDRPTLVFVDDRRNIVERSGAINPRQTRLAIAQTASQRLMEKEIITTTISPRDAVSYAMRNDKHSELLPIDAIGRAVGADQVIYIEIVSFRGTLDGFTPQPNGSCEVRVIDVENRERLFPLEGVSVPVEASVFGTSFRDMDSTSGQFRIYEELAEEMGRSVVRLFYEYETLEVGDSVNIP